MHGVLTREHRIDTGRGDIHAKQWTPEIERPDAPAPIVLLHDSLGCVELWRDFPQRLAAVSGRRVIAYDRLGFGRSDAHPGRLPLARVPVLPRRVRVRVRLHPGAVTQRSTVLITVHVLVSRARARARTRPRVATLTPSLSWPTDAVCIGWLAVTAREMRCASAATNEVQRPLNDRSTSRCIARFVDEHVHVTRARGRARINLARV